MRPVRILIADDHELVRQGMSAILSAESGWVVCGAAINGREALSMAFELRPDLVIVDLGLPEMNGIEVTQRIRDKSDVPILIVTVHDVDEMVRQAIAAGANGYMLKADAARVLEAVRTILHGGEFISEGVHMAANIEPSGDETGKPLWNRRRLTAREREVLQLLAEGRTNKEVAAALDITTKTAETHRARIMAKLEMHSVSELVRFAVRNRIVEP